jgi:hypothetical protein
LRPRSRRPLITKSDSSQLPPINSASVNTLPWVVLAETTVGKPFHPEFAHYLRQLDGKQVELAGFIQPLGEERDISAFLLIEYPVGCWYCETPELSGIVRVEPAAGKGSPFSRNLVKVVGRLSLNTADPENFLYTLREAKVSEAD